MALPVPEPVTVAVTVAGALPARDCGWRLGRGPARGPARARARDCGRGPWPGALAGPYPCPCGSIIAFNLPPSIPSQHSLSPKQAH